MCCQALLARSHTPIREHTDPCTNKAAAGDVYHRAHVFSERALGARWSLQSACGNLRCTSQPRRPSSVDALPKPGRGHARHHDAPAAHCHICFTSLSLFTFEDITRHACTLAD